MFRSWFALVVLCKIEPGFRRLAKALSLWRAERNPFETEPIPIPYGGDAVLGWYRIRYTRIRQLKALHAITTICR